MKVIVCALSLFVFNIAFAKYDILKVPRKDGSSITAYFKYPENMKDLSILINISGSKCKSEFSDSPVSENYKKFRFSQVQVEKYGIDEKFTNKQCGEVYRKFNNINQRKQDHISVLDFIKKKYNIWNGRVYIIGGSEGTVVAPLLVNSHLDIRAMALWAGARSMTMAEEFLLNLKKGNHLCKDTQSTTVDFMKKFKEILRDNKSTELWCSSPEKGSVNSYQWWSHILDYNPTKDFLNFKGQIYVAHGTRDRMMPIESTKKLQKIFKDNKNTNLEVKIHEDLDHGCNDSQGSNHCNTVFTEIHQWLLNKIQNDV